MAENIELGVYTSELISLSKILARLHDLHFHVGIKEMQIFDDWDFSNLQKPDVLLSMSEIDALVQANKIVLVLFAVDSLQNSGCHFHRLEEHLYEVGLWVDTVGLPPYTYEPITPDTEGFYDEVTQSVLLLASTSLVLAGMGVEFTLHYKGDPITTIQSSHHVSRWIVPETTQVRITGYTEQHIPGYTLFTWKPRIPDAKVTEQHPD